MPAHLVTRETCPICLQAATETLFDCGFTEEPISGYLSDFYRGQLDMERLQGGRYALEKCLRCSLVYQRQVPDEPLLAHLYGEVLGSTETRPTRSLKVRRGYAFQIEQLRKYFDDVADSPRVMDYGAGYGDWLQMAAAYGCETFAVELAETKAEQLEGAGHVNFAPHELPEKSFHFINTEQVFEHLVDPRQTLAELACALKPGGLVRISVPNGTDIEDRLGTNDWSATKGSPNSLNAVAPLEHVNCFRHEALVQLGESAELKPFVYPAKQFFDSWERIRFIGSAAIHALRPPNGTLVLFRKPA